MKLRKRCYAAFILVILACSTPMSVLAIDDRIDVCYTINDEKEKVSIPSMYSFEQVLRGEYDGIEMNNPSDLFVDDNYMLIADTGNNRIIKFTKSGEFIQVFDNEAGGGLVTPKGVTVDKNQNIYIADSGNQRIVVLDKDGQYLLEQGKPDSELLTGLSVYEPTKIAIGTGDTLHVLVGKEFMSIGQNNEFLGYVGSAEVGFSFKNMFISLFASEQQKKLITKVQPENYNNFTVDDDGMIYAITYGVRNQIRKITSVGDNIYPEGYYGEYLLNEHNAEIRPNFSDIAVSKEGIVFIADLNSGRIYQYDRNGELLSVFGGEGSGQGLFLSISAVDVDEEGNLYVLDSGYGNVQIFKPTFFNKLVVEATNLYEEGEYETAFEKWKEILEIHDSYPIALNTVAKIMYKNKEYKTSLEYYELASNQKGYGKSNAKVQHEWVSKHFLVVCLILTAVLIGAFWGVLRFKNYADRMNHDLNYGTNTREKKKRKQRQGGI